MFIQWDCGSETAGGLCHEETHTLSHTHHSTPNKGTHRWRLWRTESLNKRKVEQCHASLFIHCQHALLSRCKAMNTHTDRKKRSCCFLWERRSPWSSSFLWILNTNIGLLKQRLLLCLGATFCPKGLWEFRSAAQNDAIHTQDYMNLNSVSVAHGESGRNILVRLYISRSLYYTNSTFKCWIILSEDMYGLGFGLVACSCA